LTWWRGRWRPWTSSDEVIVVNARPHVLAAVIILTRGPRYW
jgi:hypothetical protein